MPSDLLHVQDKYNYVTHIFILLSLSPHMTHTQCRGCARRALFPISIPPASSFLCVDICPRDGNMINTRYEPDRAASYVG